MTDNVPKFDLLLPIIDEHSARLKLSNALYLLQLGSIDTVQAAAVFREASEAVYRAETRQAA